MIMHPHSRAHFLTVFEVIIFYHRNVSTNRPRLCWKPAFMFVKRATITGGPKVTFLIPFCTYRQFQKLKKIKSKRKSGQENNSNYCTINFILSLAEVSTSFSHFSIFGCWVPARPSSAASTPVTSPRCLDVSFEPPKFQRRKTIGAKYC